MYIAWRHLTYSQTAKNLSWSGSVRAPLVFSTLTRSRTATLAMPTLDVAGTSPRVQDESRPYDRRSELDGLGLPSGYGSEIDNSVHGMLFRLSKEFVEMEGQGREAPFGFNGLGELVYRRTYSRFLREDGDAKEEWYQTVERVVNGTFSMQKEWMLRKGLVWDEAEAQESAEEMYRRMFAMKFLPPGRGLWAMGSKLTTERKLYAALNNCAFVSTQNLAEDPTAPFCFLMDASMLGVGVGFDTKGAGAIVVVRPGSASHLDDAPTPHLQRIDSAVKNCLRDEDANGRLRVQYQIEDSREGWREALRCLLEAYFLGKSLPSFDTSLIRPAGTPIRGFGGISQGKAPLEALLESVEATLDPLIGRPLGVTAIVDIMNKVGVCVVSGNVRRTAEIAFGDPLDEEYIDLKDYNKHPERAAHGWTSNNSVLATLGMDYSKVCERVRMNGEPGFAWLENMQAYSRMGDGKDSKDANAMGGNPCLEQTLESFEMCCLVETFPNKHESREDFLETLRYAFLYAKTVTLGATHWPQTNNVMLRNRRIGCSMSGLAQFVAARGLGTLQEWCEEGYQRVMQTDKKISEQLGIPTSIKTTSIKPSGTVSLLAGATPGMHYPESRFYLRRVRLSADSDLIPTLQEAGYSIEASTTDPEGTVVVKIPVDVGEGVRTVEEVSMWEQLSFAAFLQRFWADNQVSCTVTFDPDKEGPHLTHALDYFQYQLKGVSFLPRINYGAFPQMPYEAITQETYEALTAGLRRTNFRSQCFKGAETVSAESHRVQDVPDKFCDTDGCQT